MPERDKSDICTRGLMIGSPLVSNAGSQKNTRARKSGSKLHDNDGLHGDLTSIAKDMIFGSILCFVGMD